MQFDADTVGSASMAADAEVCMMIADTMEQLGIPRGSYVVKVNNRKVLDGVMEAIGIGGEENAGKRLTVLRAIDKLDKFSEADVQLLLTAGRKDQSGDFTKGAGLSPTRIAKSSSSCESSVASPIERSTKEVPSALERLLEKPGSDELARDFAAGHGIRLRRCSAFVSIRPSSAASNTTPARCLKLS